jgi:hypothetical protein
VKSEESKVEHSTGGSTSQKNSEAIMSLNTPSTAATESEPKNKEVPILAPKEEEGKGRNDSINRSTN